MRIYTSESNPLDFCNRCFPKTEVIAFEKYGNLGDGPDDRGNCFEYDADAPWFYSDHDHGYCCETCGKKLTETNSTQHTQ